MKMTAAICLMLLSTAAFSEDLAMVCESKTYKILVHYSSPTQITVSVKGETVPADGIVGKDEIDLVARFPRLGEMTLYARIGKTDPSNYLFLKGKRNPVLCR